ncbi:MAG: OsmC family protein [Rhodobacteraceae bacterium]|nr:OsmC family protein [Paracoccaceae bacterium]
MAEAGLDGFRQEVSIDGRHQLVADDRRRWAGPASGRAPINYLSAALGACTTMTVRLYARRHEIPLAHVAVDVAHDKSHAKDCADCDKSVPKVDVFRREIRLEGSLTTEHRALLLEIAGRCPVHRTLATIETQLA